MKCRSIFFLLLTLLLFQELPSAAPSPSSFPIETLTTDAVPEPFSAEFARRIHLSTNSSIGRIVISDKKQGISDATWLYVKAALDHFKETRPACIILELNTPGGEVFAAQRISDALRSMDIKEGIPVIAYVNNWAISAGAMIAYSCRFIIAASDASMGAATPVFQTTEGPAEAPEKINSALRTDFANRAVFFDRNPDIARAMVDADLILVRRHGRIIALTSEEDIQSIGQERDEIISPRGKLVTLTAQQMEAFGVADMVLPKDVAFFPDDEIPHGAKISQTPFRLLPGFDAFPDLLIETFQMDMKTSIVAFLASPFVSSALVFIAFVCLYIELSAPGISLPGVVGGLAILLLLVGSFAQAALTWFEPLCILVGAAFITVELTLFPAFGLLFLTGGAMVLFGIASLVIPGIEAVRIEGDALNAAGEYVVRRLAWLAGAFLLALAVIVAFTRRLSMKALRLSGIVLEKPSPLIEVLSDELLGKEANVVVTLRPAGKIECRGRRYDAVSDGQYIEENSHVRIKAVHGNMIVVEPL